MTVENDDAIVLQLVKVLAMHGIAMSARGVADLCGDLNTNGLLRGLRRAGLDARLVRLRDGDLGFLPASSLVWLDDGPPAILVTAGPRSAKVELPTGETQRLRGKALWKLRGRAIAVRSSPKADGSSIGRLLAAIRKDPRAKRAVPLVVFTSLAGLALGLGQSMLSRVVLNEAVPDRAPAKLMAAAVAIFLLFAHMAWSAWIRRRALIYLETKLSELGVEEIVRHLLGLPFARLDRLELGQVLELSRLAQASAQQLLVMATSVLDGIIALGYLGFVFWLDVPSGIAALVGAVALVGLGVLSGRKAFELREATLEASRKQQQTLVETVAGIETLKAEAAEERALVRYLSRLVNLQGLAIKEQEEASTHTTLSTALDRFAYGAILFFVAGRVLGGNAQVGDLLAAIQASASFFASAQALARLPTLVFTLRAQAKRVDDMLAQPTEPLDPNPPTAAAPEGEDALVLRNAWFRYDPAAPWVLKGIDVVVPRGATVVLEWPSGAGKSTLLRLIAGLLSPERGDVLVFGTEAARARHLVAYLPQQASLLPMSIMDNLRLLSGGAPVERIAAAAEATGLGALLKTWPMGFETVVSAGGGNVSSGQRQLVLFTAAIASPAPVLLLDEAFAHMDGVMRTRLATLDLLRGRTVIAVVHDASLRERAGATASLVIGKQEGVKLLNARPGT